VSRDDGDRTQAFMRAEYTRILEQSERLSLFQYAVSRNGGRYFVFGPYGSALYAPTISTTKHTQGEG
jgi:hypothetical protein